MIKTRPLVPLCEELILSCFTSLVLEKIDFKYEDGDFYNTSTFTLEVSES